MKRIIICSDGTWNTQDQIDEESGKRRPTNVTKVARTILPIDKNGVHQVIGYFEGVGTGPSTDRFTGGAFGVGVVENAVAMYRFLLYNYVPGDEIYLFGFSRGAFTVRTLVGFMEHVGLLKKKDDYYVPEMFALYEVGAVEASAEWAKAFRNSSRMACPPIKFVGVWDTVAALGAPGVLGRIFNDEDYDFHKIGLSNSVLTAYHALAIDEHRATFEPMLWRRPAGWNGMLEQAWFCGAHSNVGGSYKPDGLANEALHWIVEKAELQGLEFDKHVLEKYEPHFASRLVDSMNAMYRVLGKTDRKIGDHQDHGEVLHQSVVDRWAADDSYRPKSLSAALVSSMKKAQTTRITRQA